MNHLILLADGGNPIMNLVPLIAIIGVMYFFMIRPQMQTRKKQKNFNADLKVGARIVTIGGIHGKILQVNDNNMTIMIDEKTKVTIQKEAISMEMSMAAYPANSEAAAS